MKHIIQGEFWKPIVGVSSKFEISSLGRVIFKETPLSVKRKYISPFFENNHLYIEILGKKYLLYDLLLKTLNEKYYYTGCKVIFRDGNPENVTFDNLRFKQHKDAQHSNPIQEKIWNCGNRAASANARWKATTGEKITASDIFTVLERCGRLCFYCGGSLTPATFQVDHFLPRVLNGDNRLTNIVASCANCNSIKGTFEGRQFIEFCRRVANNNKDKDWDA